MLFEHSPGGTEEHYEYIRVPDIRVDNLNAGSFRHETEVQQCSVTVKTVIELTDF